MFGRIEFYHKKSGPIPVDHLRSILLAPVSKFALANPSYQDFLVQQLASLGACGSAGDSMGSLEVTLGAKYLALARGVDKPAYRCGGVG